MLHRRRPGDERFLVSSRRDVWHCDQRVKSWFHQARESCFSWSERPLGALWQTPSGLSCAIYFFTVWAL
uniref:Uncharacterized protein n=1 Tax=Anguilla anguilla TaxID=7936 RepID=A0A0E9QNS2_ANGAN